MLIIIIVCLEKECKRIAQYNELTAVSPSAQCHLAGWSSLTKHGSLDEIHEPLWQQCYAALAMDNRQVLN